MDKPFEEKRQHPRVYRNFILSYYEKSKPIIEHKVSQVNNVSRGGINFSSTHPIQQGVVLTIDLKTPFITNSIIQEGFVLECKEKIPDIIYEIRVKFYGVPDQVLTVLEKIENYGKA